MSLSTVLAGDKVALSTGVVALTGTKDPLGRAVVVLDPSKQDSTKYSHKSMTRAFWYYAHAALEDEMTQRYGLVLLVLNRHSKLKQFDRGLSQMIISSIKGKLPLRLSGIHFCHPPMFMSIIFPIVKLFLGERLRKRIHVHSGSDEQVLHSLEKFGLNVFDLPTELSGQVSLDPEGWLEEREREEL